MFLTFQNGPLPFNFSEFLTYWLFREISAFPIYLRALINPNIGWRVGTYRLCWGGRIRPPNT